MRLERPLVMNDNQHFLSLDQIKMEELNILLAFDAFCKEHSFSYSLAYGTLLGAVRHGGFIPWDDDIDVLMPRPDYERMLSMNEPISRSLNLGFANIRQSNNGDPLYPSTYTKLINKDIETSESYAAIALNQRLFIDIFPIDGIDDVTSPQSNFLKNYWKKSLLLASCLAHSESPIKEAARALLRVIASDPYLLASKLDDSLQSLDWESSTLVSDISSSSPKFFWTLPKDEFMTTEEMEFEGHVFPVMKCWQQALENWYGPDYMELPPEDKRITHKMKAWRLS